jgi:hypothetical protein
MPTLQEEVAKYDILMAVNDESETDTIHAFKSDNPGDDLLISKDFDKWAEQAGYGDKLSLLKQKMEEERARPDDSQYEKEWMDKTMRSTEELKKLSQELQLPSHSYELLIEAKKRRIIGSVGLYEHVSWGVNG